MDPQPDWFVLEMSSFQLADTDRFQPDIGVLTNLAPDHLDRYASEEAYYADKARIFRNATEDSRWVLYRDDPAVERLAGEALGRRYWFGTGEGFEGGHLVGESLELEMDGERAGLGRTTDLSLLGRHNAINALAAVLTARLAGAGIDDLRQGLGTFSPLPHRLEPVADRDGVLWVNDSKATNVAAARSAMGSLDRPVVVLLGGKDKGEALSGLLPDNGPPIRAAVTYGAAGSRIAQALEGQTRVRHATGLVQAVGVARQLAERGDAILLAPACSSFDEFTNYEERGRLFSALARGDA